MKSFKVNVGSCIIDNEYCCICSLRGALGQWVRAHWVNWVADSIGSEMQVGNMRMCSVVLKLKMIVERGEQL